VTTLTQLLAPLRIARALRAAGVLGMNERNQRYTLAYNSRRLYPVVDDKLQTKRLCEQHGIPTASVLGIARYQAEVGNMLDSLDALPAFVLKPARGAMGNGILVMRERREDAYVVAGGHVMDRDDVAHHASSILSGMFALGGRPDVAVAEELLTVHPALARLSTDGVPDLRLVVFRGVPVMAMTRLPTRDSGGCANLHQGAVGVGVDIRDGRTLSAVVAGEMVERHPDTNEPLIGVPIPDFDRAMQIAVEATSATGLGYVGADVVIDAHKGALILELNARPGLAIQLANGCGLAPRLRIVEEIPGVEAWPPEDRIALGRDVAGRSHGSMERGGQA
jgi:alpha-L-glutamate ligase-like protein